MSTQSAERIVATKKLSFGRWAVQVGWKHLVALAFVAFALFPIVYILSTSLSNANGIATTRLFQSFYWQNYVNIFLDPKHPYGLWYWNTIYIALVSSFFSVSISAFAAFAFSRLRFRGRRASLLTLILLQMFPSALGLVAVYNILSNLSKVVPGFNMGLNSHLGLILVYLGGSLGGGTYLMYGFFNTVPREIDEAARIDGATHTVIFWTIILRLVAPILAVQMLLTFIGISSDYLLPAIAIDPISMKTLATGLQSYVSDPYSKDWALFCAGSVMAAIPTVGLFLYLQRYIVSGLISGSVKG